MKDDGVVVDTNIIQYFYSDLVLGRNEEFLVKFVMEILKNCGIVINQRILSEYELKINTIGFKDWMGTQILEKKVDFINEKEETRLKIGIKKIIHNKFGLPKNSVDIHFITCANHTKLKVIITNDMDFFDPKKKLTSSKERVKIVQNRSGALCRYLEKEHNIRVGLPEYCHYHLCKIGCIKSIQ